MSYNSPNYNERPEGAAVDTLVLHYTGMESAEAALERMCDPEAEVSAHYCVLEEGEVIQLVDDAMRAWHAGKSYWRGRENINDVSIGIEIVNPGHEFGYQDFPEAQMDAVEQLASDMVSRYRIEPRNVVAHSDIAPDRKQDPGEKFDWKRLAGQGVGLWAESDAPPHKLYAFGDVGKEVLGLQQRLLEFGYYLKPDGFFGAKTQHIVEAFQRHFVQERIDGIWTERCEDVLGKLFALLQE